MGIALSYLLWLSNREKGGGGGTKTPSNRTKLNRKLKLASRRKEIPHFANQGLSHSECFAIFLCVHTDVCIIPSCCWQALESEFHFKKEEMFRHWQRTLKQTAHYGTMPKLFTIPDSTWPSHDNVQTRREWVSISLAGYIHRGSEFMEEGITRAKQLSK